MPRLPALYLTWCGIYLQEYVSVVYQNYEKLNTLMTASDLHVVLSTFYVQHWGIIEIL